MDELGLDFDRNEWSVLDEEADELNLRSLIRGGEEDGRKEGDNVQESRSFGGSGRDALLFLVDFRRDMVEKVGSEGVSLFASAMRCAAEVCLIDLVVSKFLLCFS